METFLALNLASKGIKVFRKEEKEETEAQFYKDFSLAPIKSSHLFHEYLEIVIQFGFITIFSCTFPIAPLFALLNNVLEIRSTFHFYPLSLLRFITYLFRLDAKKMLIRYRKPTARIVNNVGIWHDIMVGLARIAVITNAFLIAVTSDLIPRMVYTTYHSPTGEDTFYLVPRPLCPSILLDLVAK